VDAGPEESPENEPQGSEPVEELSYVLPDPGLSLTLPGDLAVITRTELRDHGILDAAGLDLQELRQFMRETNCRLYALNPDMTQEILLTVYENESRDYMLLSDEELDALAASPEMELTLAALGTSSSVYGIYRTDNAAWLILDLQNSGEQWTIHGSEYYTVRGGRALTIALQSSSGPLSAEQFALLRSIVDSVSFTE
jgi:hypothetical protein